MYGNNQIQFPVDQFTVQPMRIDPLRPPVVFDIRCAPWLQPLVPWITGIFMDMVTVNAQGPITVHFYNRMAQNNWQNQEFAGEIANLADYIFLQAGPNQNPQVIPNYVQTYYGLRSKFEVQLAQGLRGYIAQQDMYVFDQAIAQFGQEIQRIVALRNGQTPPPPQQMMAPQQQYMPPPVQQQVAYQGMGQSTQYVAPQATAYQPPRASGGGGRDYGGGAPTVMAPPPQPQPVQRTMPPPVPQAPLAPQPVQAAPVGQPQVKAEDLRDPKTTPWNPPPLVSPMLFNPAKIKMMYVLDANGRTNSQPVKTNMDPINFDRHNIATLFGRVPMHMDVVKDNTQITTEIKQGALEALEESQEVDNDSMRIGEHFGLREIMSAASLDEAIRDLRTEMEAKIDRENPPMVFQAYAQIFTGIMGEKTEYELIDKLGDSSTYLELREKLNAASGTASPAIITDISLKLTNLMNDLLRHRMTIKRDEMEVEDFATDLEQLLTNLKKNYGDLGDRMYRAFTHDQAQRIAAMFSAPDLSKESGQALHNDLVSGRLTNSWEGREDLPAFTFYGPTVRITFLNVISHDLMIQTLEPDLASVITKTHSQVLYDLAVSLFEAKLDDLIIDRQYVVTKDGRVIEINKGELIDDTYMMHLVK
jgi:hypothetical protein